MGLGKISSNLKNITIEMIEEYSNKPWDWRAMSWNKNITLDIINKYPNKPWNWDGISRNSNITMEFIENNPINLGIGKVYP